MKTLLTYFDTIHPLSEDLRQYLQQIVKKKELIRNQYLLREGQICRNIYFIDKGLLRCYADQEKVEVCSWFMREGDICTAVESFFKQEPSQEYIQALESTVVYYINYDDLQKIYEKFPEFNFNVRVLIEKHYIFSEQKLSAMRLRRSHERYAWLFENFPELIQRVPSKFIASYLGVTEVTLSMIRSRK